MAEPISPNTSEEKKDIYRHSLLRSLGYTNIVGELFVTKVPYSVVRASYYVTAGYIFADTATKTKEQLEGKFPNTREKWQKGTDAVVDSLMWHLLASIAIPYYAINRIGWVSGKLLLSYGIPAKTQKLAISAIGAGSIPIISKPIDIAVDWAFVNIFNKVRQSVKSVTGFHVSD